MKNSRRFCDKDTKTRLWRSRKWQEIQFSVWSGSKTDSDIITNQDGLFKGHLNVFTVSFRHIYIKASPDDNTLLGGKTALEVFLGFEGFIHQIKPRKKTSFRGVSSEAFGDVVLLVLIFSKLLWRPQSSTAVWEDLSSFDAEESTDVSVYQQAQLLPPGSLLSLLWRLTDETVQSEKVCLDFNTAEQTSCLCCAANRTGSKSLQKLPSDPDLVQPMAENAEAESLIKS